eukprot:COSAG01_NODE_40053_length_468_cov_1.070461_1_plen_29_part_01
MTLLLSPIWDRIQYSNRILAACALTKTYF